MATWEGLLETPLRLLPTQVVLATGEISVLVLDKVRQALQGVDYHTTVTHPSQISSFSIPEGLTGSYILHDPSPEILQAAERSIRAGRSESFIILISGDPNENYDKSDLEYVKKRAMQAKTYFTLTPPKTDAAREKMLSQIILNLHVTRDLAHRVGSTLEYSPGRVYLFMKQYLLATGGSVLTSSKAEEIVLSILGDDSPNAVVTTIVTGGRVNREFSEEFTNRVLNFLQGCIQDAYKVQSALNSGRPSVTVMAKELGIPVFRVLQCLPMAESYSPSELLKCEDLIIFLQPFVGQNPDVLSVLSRLWRH